jgi:hypothetical protein
MFLPKLMIDRYGWPGFVVFAIPNVIGCAGFGYVLATRGRSGAMVEKHGPAMVVFSLVAIAFHMYFVPYFLAAFMMPADAAPWLPMAAAAGVFIVGLVLALLDDRAWLALAGLAYLFSLIAFGMIGLGASARLSAASPTDAAQLAWLSAVIVIGFLLCPYLDLTFHRALQASWSRHAFGVFGLTFAVMIAFTCFLWYAPTLAKIAVAHILAQSVFTVGAHLREVRRSPVMTCSIRRSVYMLLPLAVIPLYPVLRVAIDHAEIGSETYLRFLVFYGLAFPAYVLLFIGPWRPVRLSRNALFGLAAVIVIFAPLYELAFLHDVSWLLAIPAGAAVLWALIRRMKTPASA